MVKSVKNLSWITKGASEIIERETKGKKSKKLKLLMKLSS